MWPLSAGVAAFVYEGFVRQIDRRDSSRSPIGALRQHGCAQRALKAARFNIQSNGKPANSSVLTVPHVRKWFRSGPQGTEMHALAHDGSSLSVSSRAFRREIPSDGLYKLVECLLLWPLKHLFLAQTCTLCTEAIPTLIGMLRPFSFVREASDQAG